MLRKTRFLFAQKITLAAIVLIVSLSLFSCKSTEYVPYEVSHTEWLHDSIDCWHTHYVYTQGDTVHVVDTIFRDRVRTVWKHDSVEKPKPYPVEVEVEKELAWWQKGLMWMGVLFIGGLVVKAILFSKKG